MQIILGLIGAKGSGKTTTFEVVKNIVDSTEITLANKLKNVSAEVTGIPREAFDSHDLKEKELTEPVYLNQEKLETIYKAYDLINGDFNTFHQKFIKPHIGKILMTPRQVAQYVGTEVLRAVEPDIHCLAAVKDAGEATVGIVTDMRFPNEYDFFKKHEGVFIPVYIKNTAAEVIASKDTHASEAYLFELAKKAQYTLENNGTLQQFEDKVKTFVTEVISKCLRDCY